MLSCVQLFVTPWTVAHQAPLSMEFSRKEYWCGFPCPSPGDLPGPGIEPRSPALQADSLPYEPPGNTHRFLWDITYYHHLSYHHHGWVEFSTDIIPKHLLLSNQKMYYFYYYSFAWLCPPVASKMCIFFITMALPISSTTNIPTTRVGRRNIYQGQ